MKIYGIIRIAIFWALTVVVLVFVSALAEIETLRYFIGGVLIFYGVEETVYTVFNVKKHYSINLLFWNVLEIIIGLVLIVFVETDDIEVTYAVVCSCWAIWSIFREAHELADVTVELKENKLIPVKIVAILSTIESLTIIALSLTMIIEPGEHHARMHLYLLAVELFTRALFPFINYTAERYHEKKKAKVADSVSVQSEEENVISETETPNSYENTQNQENLS